jgi:hypothetical protein
MSTRFSIRQSLEDPALVFAELKLRDEAVVLRVPSCSMAETPAQVRGAWTGFIA